MRYKLIPQGEAGWLTAPLQSPPPNWIWHVTQLWPLSQSQPRHTKCGYGCVGNPNPAVSIVPVYQTTGPATRGAKKNSCMNKQLHKDTETSSCEKTQVDFIHFHRKPSLSQKSGLCGQETSQLGSIEAWICTVTAQSLLTGRRRGKPSHAATEIRLGEVICLLCRERKKKREAQEARLCRKAVKGKEFMQTNICDISSLHTHSPIPLAWGVPNAKVGLTKTEWGYFFWLASVENATSTMSMCSSHRAQNIVGR